MRVLHVIPSLSPKRGGPSFAVRAMAESIAAHGVTVDVVTTDDDEAGHLAVPLEQPIVEGGVTYRYFRRQTSLYTFSAPLTCWLARHVGDYDIVHIHALFSYSALPAAWMARIQRVPYIVRPLGTLNRWGLENRRPMLKRVSLRFIEKPILEQAEVIHFTSEQERIEAEAAGHHYPAVEIPLGIDLAPYTSLPSADGFFRRYPDLKNKPLILFLSRLHPKKGLDILLSAFALVVVRNPEARLAIVGDGDSDYVASLQLQARALGIDDYIAWPGSLYDTEKLAVLAAADLFVLPSYSENFGLAVVEALAAGLPVVVSDQVGIHRDVALAGLVVACAAEPLAQALIALLNDPGQRQRLGSAGRRLAQERFSNEALGEKLVSLYAQCINNRRHER